MNDIQHICHYLDTKHVLSLCTSAEHSLWCASLFYSFHQQHMAFQIMTDKQSLHSIQMLQNPHIAGTVSDQYDLVEQIKGIQYRGTIQLLHGDEEALAREHYCHRFPVAKNMPAPVWSIQLSEIKMTDNSLGFGHKLYWKRG